MDRPYAEATGISEVKLILDKDITLRKKLELVRELCISAEEFYGDAPQPLPRKEAAWACLSVYGAFLVMLIMAAKSF